MNATAQPAPLAKLIEHLPGLVPCGLVLGMATLLLHQDWLLIESHGWFIWPLLTRILQ